MNRIFTLLLICCSVSLFAQNKITPSSQEKYWIYFSDKKASPFSLSEPKAFLSDRAIERRKRYGIAIDNSDIPVNSDYINSLVIAGIQPITVSHWMNAVSVNMNQDQIAQVALLPFVSKIERVRKYHMVDGTSTPYNDNVFYKTEGTDDIESLYGFAQGQIEQINLDTILELGYTGDSMVIAMLDAGFFGADTATLYNSFWAKSQILGVHNFPDNNNDVFSYISGIHGAWTMSVIGGDIPDTFSGSSPNVKFYLFRTEVGDSEHVVEEDYWQAAAEKADSLGVDVINSSLGYTEFDDPLENHTYADLDGNTTVVTNAADMAAEKGILVCNSAGNEGDKTWHYVSMPSDGDSVFCIGAVDVFGTHAPFSSFGPTSDGRLKPNVVADGWGSAMLDPFGEVVFLSGTSFSSPLMAGACASLWQAFPAKNNMEIIDAVQRSASLYLTPNDSMGYGIPNFGIAYEILLSETDTIVPEDTTTDTTIIVTMIDVYSGAVDGQFFVNIEAAFNEPAELTIYNMNGEALFEEHLFLNKESVQQVMVDTHKKLSAGIYLITLTSQHTHQGKTVFVK